MLRKPVRMPPPPVPYATGVILTGYTDRISGSGANPKNAFDKKLDTNYITTPVGGDLTIDLGKENLARLTNVKHK